MPKICKNTKITENAKYHQKGQISPKMPKIAQNAKTKKSPGMPYTKKMPNITTNAKNCTTFQNHKKRPKICKSANNHRTCQKSTKMSKCQIAEIPK